MFQQDAVAEAPSEAIIADALNDMGAFRGLSREDRLVLASRAEVLTLRRGKVLFKHGDCDPWMYLLLAGELSLKAADGREHRVSGGTPEASRVISRLKPRLHTATALGPVTVMRIDGNGIGYWHASVDTSMVQVEELAHSDYLDADGGACAEAAADFELPSMPDVAMKVRALIDRDDCDVDTVARMLLNDPSMAAKLIRAANSPVFYGAQGVSACDKAIVRLGLRTTRHLIIAFAVRQLFDFDTPALSGLLHELWDHSTEVAAIASVLARHNGKFDPGEAQLAGLLHDVGVIPVLDAAARKEGLRVDSEAVMALISSRRGQMGSDVLRSWHFPEPLVEVAAEAENWHRDEHDEADLTDLVVVSQLLSFIGKGRIVEVPPMARLPAFRKVMGEGTKPADVLEFLEEAEERIDEIRSLLRS